MYGEKDEECEELKMDLQDVKEMYRLQVDGFSFNYHFKFLRIIKFFLFF